jgi:quinol monooxygenase YgiN
VKLLTESQINFMANLALWVTLEAKKGKESEVETFLREALSLVNEEHGTVSWYALKLGPTSYGIFDTFITDKEREAHLAGAVANKLKEKADELFSKPPTIERIDILASKLPELEQY